VAKECALPLRVLQEPGREEQADNVEDNVAEVDANVAAARVERDLERRVEALADRVLAELTVARRRGVANVA
jgi:hypothetical protein